MKRIIFSFATILEITVANAATPQHRASDYYHNTSSNNHYIQQQRYTSQEYIQHNKNDNDHPSKFYISVKGGYNLMYGSMYTAENDNKGFTFSTGKPIFSGALGIDFNKVPSFRVELEIANVAASKAKFDDGWDSKLHTDIGYTSYMLNFIPYLKATDTTTFNIILGLGAASVDFKDTDHNDFFYLQSGKTAFAVKFGIGLDIALTDNFSILPEIQYNLLMTNVKYGLANIYFGYVESEAKTFLMHNCQFMIGAKYTF